MYFLGMFQWTSDIIVYHSVAPKLIALGVSERYPQPLQIASFQTATYIESLSSCKLSKHSGVVTFEEKNMP